MSERYSIESIGTKKHPCFYVNDAVNGDVAACRYSLAEAEQAKRELDLLEQPAQPVAKNDARYWTAGPGADVLKRDRLLTLLAETTAAREKAAQEVAERSKTLGECLAMERRLSDALRGSQPVAKPVLPTAAQVRGLTAKEAVDLVAKMNELHAEALTMNAKFSGVAAQPLRKLSPQDFDDRMAGYAARLRQYPGAY